MGMSLPIYLVGLLEVYLENLLRLTATAQRIESPINRDGRGLAISTKEKSNAKPVLKRLNVTTRNIMEIKILRFKLLSRFRGFQELFLRVLADLNCKMSCLEFLGAL